MELHGSQGEEGDVVVMGFNRVFDLRHHLSQAGTQDYSDLRAFKTLFLEVCYRSIQLLLSHGPKLKIFEKQEHL